MGRDPGRHVRVAWALSVVALTGCQEWHIGGEIGGVGRGEPPSLETPRKTDAIVQTTPLAVDVLWVIDNSCSMNDRQRDLANNFPLFLDFFLNSGLDWHIGVVSTDVEHRDHNGQLQPARDGTTYLDPSTPDPSVKFEDMALLGSSGSPYEQGLLATHRALAQPTQAIADANAGFYRPDAALHVIVVSDEEDASPRGFEHELVTFLTTLKASEDIPVTFNSIISVQRNGCGAWDDGSRGQRYIDVTETIGGIWTDICQDWTSVLDELATLATGRRSEFFLSEVPVPGTLDVQVKGGGDGHWQGVDLDTFPSSVTVEQACRRWHGPEQRCFGYTYNPVRNAVVMHDWTPSPLATVNVTYELLSGLQQAVDEEPADAE